MSHCNASHEAPFRTHLVHSWFRAGPGCMFCLMKGLGLLGLGM